MRRVCHRLESERGVTFVSQFELAVRVENNEKDYNCAESSCEHE